MNTITDHFFGELNIDHDQLTDTFLLDKKIKIGERDGTVVLSIESDKDSASEKQVALFKMIEKYFSEIWKSMIDFLATEKKYSTVATLEKNYKLASITLLKSADTNPWEMELLNSKDEFLSVLIEFEGSLPVDFSTEV